MAAPTASSSGSRRLPRESGQPVDWHYSGGRANVLYLGDFTKVQAAIEKLLPELEQTPRQGVGSVVSVLR
jgi:hypothetical protein